MGDRAERPWSRFWRRRPLLLYGFVALCVLLAGWSALGNWLAARTDARLPRDASTGILEGGGPFDLGPRDADRAVLFVHGFVAAPNSFWELPARVAEQGWRAKGMLLPGHGTTPFDLESTTADQLEADVRSAIEEIRREQGTVVVVAHSMGGALATLAASDLSIDGLVLGAPYFGVRHRWYYGLRPEWWGRLLAPVVRWGYRPVWSRPVNRPEAKPEIVTYTWVPVQGALTAMEVNRRALVPGVLESVTCPVLLLQGLDDSVTDPAAAERAVAAMGSAVKKTVLYPESEHVLFWDYDREAIVHEVLAFLEQFE
jgi:carboxylesterase